MLQEDSLSEILQQAVLLRQHLHQNPELSGKEINTTQHIRAFIEKTNPTQIIDLAEGKGLAAIYDSKRPGPVLLFRADTDALPINETIEIFYCSENKNISHKCGHDGHSAILAGLALLLQKNQLQKGKVILLFQPSEENGKGAEMILNDPAFAEMKPDYVFALHNLPGFEKANIIVKHGVFASASKGVVIKLQGKSAHAASPESGISPSDAFAEIIKKLNNICSYYELFNSYVLLTIVYAKLGEKAFGTLPADAVIMATLRSYDDNDMKTLIHETKQIVKEVAAESALQYMIDWSDEFIAMVNNDEAVKIIADAAKANALPLITMREPIRWSEDFGRYMQKYKGAMFGLGAGKEHPPLHSAAYDFPDDVLESGIKMFWEIIQQILSKE